MSRTITAVVVFAVGLLAVCWIGAGYIATHPLAFFVTAVIAACYVTGAWELLRFRKASHQLQHAVATLDATPATLQEWLATLPAALRNGVRLRVEGERVALPGPALTSYLVGLLVLLGMLGTLLGMMVTLRGTGMALESATDLDAIRSSLAAPVKGLAFAFGTSIAGVTCSAMLGLLSALFRRDRIEVVQQLDAATGSWLTSFSNTHERRQTFRLLQEQNAVLPTLVESLQAMVAAIEQQQRTASEQLLASQQAFVARSEVGFSQLAGSLQQALASGVSESANAVSAQLTPLLETSMSTLARQANEVYDHLTQAVRQQLDGVSRGLQDSSAVIARSWDNALAEQQNSNQTLGKQLHDALQQFTATFEQRSSGLVDTVAAHLQASTQTNGVVWRDALQQLQAAHTKTLDQHGTILSDTRGDFASRTSALMNQVQASLLQLQDTLEARDQQRLGHWDEAFKRVTASLDQQLLGSSEQISARQQQICDTLAQTAEQIGARVQQQAEDNTRRLHDTAQVLAESANQLQERSGTLLDSLQNSQLQLHTALASADEARLTQWHAALDTLATRLGMQWEQSGESTARQQQQICHTLEKTAQQMSAQTQAHAADTIAEISRLVQSASEAPKAAAEVVAELRQKLSDSMVRDTAMLEERSRLLETLETLLSAVNHASSEQRGAIDALVSTSAELLERVGTRFSERVESEANKLDNAAAHVTTGVEEVASFGEAFSTAMQLFAQSSDAVSARLQTIEGALEKSMLRSDEQLAYYAAQAREVIELSLLSQKQIIAELQQLADSRNPAGAAAA